MSKPRTFKSKEDWLSGYVQDRSVLDLGCIDHSLGRTDRPWLHDFIARTSRVTLGVDILEDEIEILKNRGYNVVFGDVQNLKLDNQYEVIVAGDIIEHLTNPGSIFQVGRDYLRPGGRLLISTPNPIGIRYLLTTIIRGESSSNSEHTCWFTSSVLRELGARFGFVVEEESYVDDIALNFSWRRGWSGGLVDRLRAVGKRVAWILPLAANSVLTRFRPRLCETLAVSFVFEAQIDNR